MSNQGSALAALSWLSFQTQAVSASVFHLAASPVSDSDKPRMAPEVERRCCLLPLRAGAVGSEMALAAESRTCLTRLGGFAHSTCCWYERALAFIFMKKTHISLTAALSAAQGFAIVLFQPELVPRNAPKSERVQNVSVGHRT